MADWPNYIIRACVTSLGSFVYSWLPAFPIFNSVQYYKIYKLSTIGYDLSCIYSEQFTFFFDFSLYTTNSTTLLFVCFKFYYTKWCLQAHTYQGEISCRKLVTEIRMSFLPDIYPTWKICGLYVKLIILYKSSNTIKSRATIKTGDTSSEIVNVI